MTSSELADDCREENGTRRGVFGTMRLCGVATNRLDLVELRDDLMISALRPRQAGEARMHSLMTWPEAPCSFDRSALSEDMLGWRFCKPRNSSSPVHSSDDTRDKPAIRLMRARGSLPTSSRLSSVSVADSARPGRAGPEVWSVTKGKRIPRARCKGLFDGLPASSSRLGNGLGGSGARRAASKMSWTLSA